MRLVVDMNLSPEWVTALHAAGHDAIHWSSVGRHNAPDTEIMAWARTERRVVLTQDLDYGALLYATGAVAPSVVVIRAEDVRPTSAVASVIAALQETASDLAAGALVTIDSRRARVRTLPFRRAEP